MNLWQSFVIALGMLKLHKMRAFLTMLGVIIGVMSVTIIVMLSEGFQSYLKTQFAKIGSDTIYLVYAPGDLGRGESVGAISGLTIDDIDFILQRCPSIILASGYREAGRQTVKSGEKELKNTSVRGVDANFIELNRVGLQSGRYLSKADNDARASVCIISEDVAKAVFGTANPLGKTVSVDSLTLEVVGVSDPLEIMGDRNTAVLFMPVMTANQKWIGGRNVDTILMRSKPGIVINDAMDEVWRTLMVRTNNKPVYRIESSENVLKVFQGVVGVAGGVLAGVAALSLLVGGIGIMNIMLVSVTERTREIGLRKSIGAKKAAILAQFLVEAGTLSLVGGLIGMAIAYTIGLGVTALTVSKAWPDKNGLALPFPLVAALMAAAFSAAIGMIFGFYPAFSAAKLDPIQALRHE